MRIKVYNTERGRIKFILPADGEGNLAIIVYYPPKGGRVIFRGVSPETIYRKVVPAFGDRVDENDLFQWWVEWVNEWG